MQLMRKPAQPIGFFKLDALTNRQSAFKISMDKLERMSIEQMYIYCIDSTLGTLKTAYITHSFLTLQNLDAQNMRAILDSGREDNLPNPKFRGMVRRKPVQPTKKFYNLVNYLRCTTEVHDPKPQFDETHYGVVFEEVSALRCCYKPLVGDNKRHGLHNHFDNLSVADACITRFELTLVPVGRKCRAVIGVFCF